MMKKSHKGKDRYKVKVEILIKKVSNIKELNGSSVFVQWKRGSSKVSGDTSHLMVRNGEAIFEEKISFESKFFIDPKSQKPDEKKVSMQLKEEKKKSSSGKVLGKIEFDVTSWLNAKTNIANLSFTKGIKPEPVLNCQFNIIPLKYNDKPLVKVTNKMDTSKDPRLVKTIAGEDYFLDKTDSEASDTVDTSIADFSNNDSFGDDDEINDDLGESKKELRMQIEQLTKERDLAEMESGERLESMRAYESEIENLKKQYRILQEDILDKEKVIEAYHAENENKLNQELEQNRLNGSGGEIDLLRAEKLEKMAIISSQEKEIAKLKKQLKQNQLSNTELGSMTGADIRTKYQTLQHENEEMEKTIAKLEKEKAELEERASSSQSQVRKRTDSSDSLGGGSNSPTGGVVTKAAGSVDELRKQSLQYKTELEEKALVEKCIYLAEPQFRGSLSVSGITLFDGLVSLGVLKDIKSGSRVFSSISTAFENIYKKCVNDNGLLAYWLSTSCLLLAKIKNKLESDSPSISPTNQSHSPYMNGQGSDEKTGLTPVNSFEYQLKSIVFKFYSKLIQNTYTRISPVLVKSILQHDIHAFNSGRLQKRKSAPDIHYQQPPFPQQQQQQQQQQKQSNSHHNVFNSNNLLNILEEVYDTLKQNYVHPALITQFYAQVFFYTNAFLLNSLNNITGLCSTANGFQIKIELSKLIDWASIASIEEANVQLEPMLEAANILVMDKKLIDDVEVVNSICTSISLYQVKHLLSLFQTDKINSEPIPPAVVTLIDQAIHQRSEEQPQTLDIDLTYMNQLSLDFLTKDINYGREARSNTSITGNNNLNQQQNSRLNNLKR